MSCSGTVSARTVGLESVTHWYESNIHKLSYGAPLSLVCISFIKVSKGAKIRNRYNQVPHLIQDTNWKVTNSQLYTTNESQEVGPFPTGNHKAQINRRAQRHIKHLTEDPHQINHEPYIYKRRSWLAYWTMLQSHVR